MNTVSLPDQIRQAIAPAHVAVEQTPFAQGMVSGRIARHEYTAGLQQIGYLHEAMESALAEAHGTSASVAKVYDPARMARLPVIERDLAALEADTTAMAHDVVSQLASEFTRWATTQPHALIGALYVMEGSRMGSMVLARSLTKALLVEPRPGTGLDYHIDGIATRPTDWKAFRGALADMPFSEAEQAEIVSAATTTMDALVTLYAAVPVNHEAPELVTA
jgi:heme oxygenase